MLKQLYSIGKYTDIGKSTSDLLNKDFPTNVIKIEAKGAEKTVTNSHVRFFLNLLLKF